MLRGRFRGGASSGQPHESLAPARVRLRSPFGHSCPLSLGRAAEQSASRTDQRASRRLSSSRTFEKTAARTRPRAPLGPHPGIPDSHSDARAGARRGQRAPGRPMCTAVRGKSRAVSDRVGPRGRVKNPGLRWPAVSRGTGRNWSSARTSGLSAGHRVRVSRGLCATGYRCPLIFQP